MSTSVVAAYVECRNDNTSNSMSNKKTKKSVITKSSTSHALDPNDQAALNRRAARFQREHELERQKGSHNGSYSSSFPAHRHITQFSNSRSNTPSFGDEPEADPVRICVLCDACQLADIRYLECSQLGSFHYRWNLPRNLQGLPTINIGLDDAYLFYFWS